MSMTSAVRYANKLTHLFFCPVMNARCTNIKSKDLVFIHIGQVQCLL